MVRHQHSLGQYDFALAVHVEICNFEQLSGCQCNIQASRVPQDMVLSPRNNNFCWRNKCDKTDKHTYFESTEHIVKSISTATCAIQFSKSKTFSRSLGAKHPKQIKQANQCNFDKHSNKDSISKLSEVPASKRLWFRGLPNDLDVLFSTKPISGGCVLHMLLWTLK